MVGDACMNHRRPRGESLKALAGAALPGLSQEHVEECPEKEAELGRYA